MPFIESDSNYLKIENPGYMDLVLEKINRDKITISHYYKQQWDLIPDPDVMIDIEKQEPVEYQDPFGYVYCDTKKKKIEVDNFLNNIWAKNTKNQGFAKRLGENIR